MYVKRYITKFYAITLEAVDQYDAADKVSLQESDMPGLYKEEVEATVMTSVVELLDEENQSLQSK